MADEKHATDDELRQILIGAIAAGPPLTGIQPGVWVAKVNEAIPFVASMMSAGSWQMGIARQVATAEVFVALYRGYTIEPSSTRAVVEFISERTNSEPETIRTHRTDGSAGKAIQARLDKLTPGDRIVLYKAFEEIKSGPQAGRKARTLVHFETAAPRSTDTPTQQGQPGSPQSPARAAVSSAPAPAGTGAGATTHDPDFGPAPETPPPTRDTNDVDTEIAAKFNDLPAKVKVNVVRRLRSVGIDYPVPAVEHIDAFNRIITEESNG